MVGCNKDVNSELHQHACTPLLRIQGRCAWRTRLPDRDSRRRIAQQQSLAALVSPQGWLGLQWQWDRRLVNRDDRERDQVHPSGDEEEQAEDVGAPALAPRLEDLALVRCLATGQPHGAAGERREQGKAPPVRGSVRGAEC